MRIDNRQNNNPRSPRYDADGEPDSGWLDSKEFAAYTVLVHQIIKRHKRGLWLGTLHRLLGERAKPQWTPTSISHLMLLGVVEEGWGCPTPYLACKPRPQLAVLPYANNSAPAPPSSRTNPFAILNDGKHRITA